MHEVTLTASDANRLLVKFLFKYLNNAPQSLVYKLLRKKRIKLNGQRAKGGELLAAGDIIGFYLSQETLQSLQVERVIPTARSLPEIVYEDEHLLVINKPAGLASHGGMQTDDHLLARILYYLQQTDAYNPQHASFTPAICNRLDVNTSGLVVCGKTLRALQEINALFASQGVCKQYLAVTEVTEQSQKNWHGYVIG
jgi:23S rRNA pseudouridine955/2504/2580 synthase